MTEFIAILKDSASDKFRSLKVLLGVELHLGSMWYGVFGF